MRLVQKINNTVVQKGEIAIFYLAQAGFYIRTASGKTMVIDAYLSDACERLFSFKRMIPSSLEAGELDVDLCLSTHHHTDHLDPDTIPIVAKNGKTIFVAAPDCESFYRELRLPESRYIILKEGEEWQWEEIRIRAVYADHGELAPDALGFLIEIDGIKVYHAGDTAFKPDEIMASLKTNVDIMIAPINGTYGNMIASEACLLAGLLKPKFVVPCHFWMFLEHITEGGKGDPATFLQQAARLLPATKGIVMAPGELFMYRKTLADV